ncbi:MAG: EAL domain-containing protein [Rhizobiaceae bacterium]|nr:EAL domain-containing protein [Rhizobiaceae bacterium]
MVTELCRKAEEFAPDAICSVLTVDKDRCLRPLAAPSLPESYSQALRGLRIGPMVGSCGAAAYLGQPVETPDIETDERWRDYKHLAIPLGLRACWSSPLKARDGRVIGTFAFYFRSRRGPNDRERAIVERCTHLCALTIEHEEIERRLHDLAYLDSFTELPNRSSFDVQLARATQSQNPSFALMLCDVDHLKEVNDTLGHAGGDEVVRTIASRLKSLAPSMSAFRLGGDEFAVLVESCSSEADLHAAFNIIRSAVEQPLYYANQSLMPSLTAGGALYGPDGKDSDTLARNASFALDHGKEHSPGGLIRFRADLRNAITARVQAVRDVADALAEDRLLPYYQPIVRLDTMAIVGVEALARITTRDGEIIAAGQFQDALTDPRIASEITACMLRKVAADIRSWLDFGIPFQHVGFNVSSPDFRFGNLGTSIEEAFNRERVPLKHLILEVTETVFMGGRDNHVALAVKELRKKGVIVALDDFGTGYASLTHLLTFPVDVLKIDKSFVDGIVSDPQSGVIVGAMIDIAQQLGMKVVTEGIETEEQAVKLLSLGCILGQGYHYGRPAPMSTTTELLKRLAQRPDSTAAFRERRAARG